jgi:flagellar hook-associated protein 1 FlgK
MGLSQALGAAANGLRVTQAGLSLVAGNVANANTPGYVRKTAVQVATLVGDFGVGVRSTAISRELDLYTQRQLRIESAGGSYADLKADFYSRLQDIYGQPGSSTALDTVFNNFTGAIQSLITSPDSSSARTGVINTAQVLAQQLNGMSADIQSLRTSAEQALSDTVSQANNALQQIARINQQLAGSTTQDASNAALLDQRDSYIDQLSTLMDIRVTTGDRNQVTIFTNSGTQLVGSTAALLKFDAKGTLTPDAQWDADPAKRSVGTITLVTPNGGNIDLIANNAFRSGKIAGLLEMRDQILPQAQAQLDQIAATMSRSLSDRTTDGTAVTAAPRAGFDVDIGSLLSGNTINLTYTDTATNTQHNITLVRVDDSKALPLSDAATTNPNDKVIGIYFGNGLASVISQINSALSSTGLQFSNPSGTTLRALDDGSPNRIDINAMSITATMTSLTSGGPELPLFTDGIGAFSGAITSSGSQTLGFASRIAVNSALAADPSRLIVYQTSPLTATGDPTRPNFLLDQLNNATFDYAPEAGVGTTAAPFSGTLGSYLRQMLSQQGDAATAAASLKQGQDIVVNTLQQRFDDQSGVNIDEEMTRLLNLQMAYGANARVMTTVRDLLDMLMKA